SGARFYFLRGVGAQLELAILNSAIDQATKAGFTPMITPTLVLPEAMEGTGFLGEHADEVYHLDKGDDLYLVGTSEVALAGYHKDEILDLDGGPIRYAGWSACYRREAGSYGKDTRGIIRVHQFHKVEMFSYCRIEDSYAEHERLLDWEREMMARIDVPYRIIDTAAGDLGTSAARKFDCEAWMPSQKTYRELTSTSNCTQLQARRLNIRERTEDGLRPVATLNLQLRGLHGQSDDLPRADLHLELHLVPAAPAEHPRAHRGRPAPRRHPQRHPCHPPLHRRDPREPPAVRRLGGGPRRPAPLSGRTRGLRGRGLR